MTYVRRILLVVILAIAVLIAAVLRSDPPARASHVTAHAAEVNLAGVNVLAQFGFGDDQNSYAWAMGWFKGRLYVGTGRNVICVEKQTTDFYYPFADVYTTHPEPGVHCTRNPFALDLRAEIWRYTPSTGRWQMVYRAPQNIPNPDARGRYVSPDIAYRQMTVVTDPHGHQALFVSGVSLDEAIPQLGPTHPPRLLRTYDGVHFHNVVGASFIVHRTGQFTDARVMGFRGIVPWRGHLYILASTALTGDGGVFRIDHPWSNHARFVQVSPPWLYVFELQTFDGSLYLGGGDGQKGYSVYKLSSPRRPFHFKPIVVRGAGRGHGMTSVISMQVYRGWLYVAAVGWYCISCNALPTTELIRIGRNDHWQLVVGNARFVPQDSETKSPISGLGDGFENIFNSHMWRMAVSGGALYVGTLDWSWLLQKDKSFLNGYPGLLSSLLAGELGFDVWATCDGTDFFPVTRNAFGVDMYDFGVRTMIGVNGGLYFGSADHAHGTRIYHQPYNACTPFAQRARATGGAYAASRAHAVSGAHGTPAADAAASRAAAQAAASTTPAAPQALMTDVQRRGTVLSWDRASSAVRYAVVRWDYAQVPFSFYPPDPWPGGLMPDDAVPIPAAGGAPGSESTSLVFPSRTDLIGITTQSYFVDRSARPGLKYGYQVIAETAAGRQSIGSNVQVVPDPRPPATLAGLEALLRSQDSAALARSAAGAAGCRARVSQLAGLARSAPSSDVRLLAIRLLRRLEYRTVGGGPVTRGLTCG